jgi:hypothetical protein
MDRIRLLSAALVVLVVLWSAGATVELFFTTFSVGANVTPAIVTVALLAVVLLAGIAVGARNRRWLANPRSYW